MFVITPILPLSSINPMLFFITTTLAELGISTTGPIANRTLLKKLELDSLFGDLRCEQLSYGEIRGGGPDGQAGVLLSLPLAGRSLMAARYSPERQSWRHVSPAVWIGTEADPSGELEFIPGPEHLERECSLHCENVRMADGSIWEVPVIREPVVESQLLPAELHRTGLPCAFYRGMDGQWATQVTKTYQPLWRQSLVMFSALVEGQPVRYVDYFEFALAVLNLRYRMNVLIHSRWPEQWLDTDSVREVVRAAVGWNIIARVLEDQKKTELTTQ